MSRSGCHVEVNTSLCTHCGLFFRVAPDNRSKVNGKHRRQNHPTTTGLSPLSHSSPHRPPDLLMDLTPFHTQGYQVLPNLVDRDVVQSLMTYLSADADDALTLLMADLRCNDLSTLCKRIDEIAAGPDFQKVPRDQKRVMSGDFPVETSQSRTLWQVPKLASVRSVLEAALNHTHLYMHLPPAARFVLPGVRQAAIKAHQDVSDNPHLSDFVTLWVPLTKIDDQCGGITVIDGQNRIHCRMEAGDALLLSKWIMHESMPNVSGRVCYSLDFQFFTGRDLSSKRLLDMQNWRVIEPVRQSAA